MKIKPDYQRLLVDDFRDRDVCDIADAVIKQDVSIGVALVRHVLDNAGGTSISDLDQDGRNKAFFELKLLAVGAKLTYERVQHNRYNCAMTAPDKLNPSLEELKQLTQCVKAIGWSTGSINRVIEKARVKTGVKGTKLSDLGNIGYDLVYHDLVYVLVNVRAHL